MKLFEIKTDTVCWMLLTEDARTEFILKTYGNKLQNISHDQLARNKSPEEIVNTLVTADPTKNKQYLQFLTRAYVTGQFRLEDVNRLNYQLTTYNTIKGKLPVEQRDIMHIKKLSDLYKITRQYEQQDPQQSNRQLKKQAKMEGANIVMDTPNFKVYNVLTKEAACLYGKGTQWCTAGDNNNMFDHYKEQGNIYVIMAGDRKFQLQMEADQFMNENDEDVNEAGDVEYLSKFPEYKTFLNTLIQQYYMNNND